MSLNSSGRKQLESKQPAENRKGIAALCSIAMVGLGAIAGYQLGWLKKLPDPPVRVFNSERIVTSRDAYKLLGIPDALLGLGSYGTTLALAWNHHRSPTETSSLLLTGKIAFDVYQAASHSITQWTQFHKLCAWCLIPTACTLRTAFLVAPEARQAIERMTA